MAGRIFKRGETYHIVFSYKGKEFRKSALTNKKREAENLLAFYLGKCARGEFKGFEEEAHTYTIAEMVSDYVADYTRRGMRDVVNLGYRATRLTAFFKEKAAAGIDERQVDLYIKQRFSQGRKHATINRELQLLKSAFRLAHRKKLVKDIPYIEIFSEKGNARQGFFEREEFESIVSFLPDYLHDVLRFAYFTGWRKMEILTLEWRDIHGDIIRLKPEVDKSKDGRTLVLVGELAAIIARRREARIDLLPYVFHRKGKRIKCYDHAWNTARVRAGLPTRIVHDARRTVARNFDRAGLSREVAKKIIGHKTDDMYKRYRIVNEQDIREGLEAAQAFLQNQPKPYTIRTIG